MNEKITPIAYYLPQFHRLKFNDDYWGKGFTEWTNTAKAKPLFKGHYQPHVPADLGFYDLTVPSIREEQADLAREYGIYGFCYWHYWFRDGYQVMERPFNEVVETGKPAFPFCLAWANHDWHNLKTKEVIIKQEYGGGNSDYTNHFLSLLSAFRDERYIRHQERLVFVIFDPLSFHDFPKFKRVWNTLSEQHGLEDFYFIGIVKNDADITTVLSYGYDAVNTIRLGGFVEHQCRLRKFGEALLHRLYKHPYVYQFKDVMKYFINNTDLSENVIPTVVSGWDHTPRSGREALVFDRCTPDVFSKHVEDTFQLVNRKHNKMVFIRAWNEWAEGNHLEPDLKYGKGFLEAIKSNLIKYGN